MVKLAAVAGVDPYSESLTPLDIFWMAEAIMEEKWDHTASLMMLHYNTNAKTSKKVEDFHPFRKKKKEHRGKKGELSGAPLGHFKGVCKNWKGDK